MFPQTVLRVGNRLLVRAVMVAAILAGLLGILYGVWIIDDTFDEAYWFTASVVTPLDLVPVVQGTIGESSAQYSEVIIYSYESLAVPRALRAVSYGLHFSLFVLASVAIVILCRRLMANRRFTSMARWSMVSIGTLAAVTSVASPLAQALSGSLAAEALGYPTSGGDDSVVPLDQREWIVPDVFTLVDTNWALLVLGVMLVLIAATFLRGEKLQLETDGLV